MPSLTNRALFPLDMPPCWPYYLEPVSGMPDIESKNRLVENRSENAVGPNDTQDFDRNIKNRMVGI